MGDTTPTQTSPKSDQPKQPRTAIFHVPIELLLDVFDYGLTKADLRNLSMVAKHANNVKDAAQDLLYSSVSLPQSDQRPLYGTRLQILLRQFLRNGHLGGRVKKLHIPHLEKVSGTRRDAGSNFLISQASKAW